MSSSTDTQTEITLKGSVDIVSEFFFTAINSILYQRGIYQPETFKRDSKYGLTVLTTTDGGLLKYLAQVMAQVESWLLNGDVQRLVVVVSGVDSGETLERWQFNVALDGENNSDAENRRPSQNQNNNTNTNNTGSLPPPPRRRTATIAAATPHTLWRTPANSTPATMPRSENSSGRPS
mmetsp:Transcript_23604/g.52493  ORF Transcript_23604/g.52493 Transcript_23604/m.52493 type:complete len:178 (-) Transcript_23604:740-1273(-)